MTGNVCLKRETACVSERERDVCKQATEAFGLCGRYSLNMAPTSPVHELRPSHHKILSCAGGKKRRKTGRLRTFISHSFNRLLLFPMALNRDETGLLRLTVRTTQTCSRRVNPVAILQYGKDCFDVHVSVR